MTEHTITEVEREAPLSTTYVKCEDCGRTENTAEKLEKRPCRDGIGVKE